MVKIRNGFFINLLLFALITNLSCNLIQNKSIKNVIMKQPLLVQPVETISDTTQVIQNPNKVSTITFTDPKLYPQKSYPIKWYYPVDPTVHPYTVISSGYFIAPLGADGLFSYSRKTGKLLAKYKRPSESGYYDHKVYKSYFIYVLDNPYQIICFSVEEGRKIWERIIKDSSEKTSWNIRYCNDEIVLLSHYNTVLEEFNDYLALDLHTGKLLWKSETPSSFALDDDGFLIFYTDRKLIKFNSKTKEVVWKRPDLPIPSSSLSSSNKQYLQMIDGQTLFYIAQDSLYLIKASDGSIINKRSHALINFALEEYLFDKNYYFDLSPEKLLTCYDTKTLKEIWCLQLSAYKKYLGISEEDSTQRIDSVLTYHQGKLFISISLESKSLIYCINPENGKVEWIKPYKIDHFLNGYGIRENKQQDEGAWGLAKSLTMVDLKDGNELWNLKISDQYYSSFYIDLKTSILIFIGSEKDNQKQIGLLNIFYNGKGEAIYKNNLGNAGYIGEFSNEDETSLILSGVYQDKGCYFEIDKNVFSK